jgi:hypothetical protein
MEKIVSEFGEWSLGDLAQIAASGCYKITCTPAEKFAMQVVIEKLVLDDDVIGYIIDDLAEAIISRLTPAPPDLATSGEYTGCGDPTCLDCEIEFEKSAKRVS